MALSDEKLKKYLKRLMMSRLRILVNNGFYGLLLMHMTFAVDEACDTAATSGKKIYFGPEFLENLSDSEIDFVMMHEILHVALQHCFRGTALDHDLFNVACDVVVNSNILKSNGMDLSTITLEKYGEAMHLAPDGSEGYEHTAEEVYDMLLSQKPHDKNAMAGLDGVPRKGTKGAKGSKGSQGSKSKPSSMWDDHSRWEELDEDDRLSDEWVQRTIRAAEAISIRDPSNQRGSLPLFAVRLLGQLRNPQTDWRTILDDFIQEEIVDYSFTPPDRRFEDSGFFLPDFNDKDEEVRDILFMIDTSGSMSDDMVTAAFSEIKGAIDQYDGKLMGWLGFFDAGVVEPKPFESVENLKVIHPKGGGGTDFLVIFKYVQKFMQDRLPVSIIILTDGYAPFPKEQSAMGIPVLWLLNNDTVEPPWGKVARITIEDN